jgi:hypothetical protein
VVLTGTSTTQPHVEAVEDLPMIAIQLDRKLVSRHVGPA